MAICSCCCCFCLVPPARGPQSSLRTPSLSLALAITLLSPPPKRVPRSLHGVAAGPKWRLEPLPRTPDHHGNCACAGSSETGGAANPFPGNRIFVKGLPISASEGRLAKTFSQFGHVTRVKIVTSKTTKQPLGFAYVWFASEEDAQLAVKEMNGKFVDGRFIYITIAEPESPTRQIRATPYRF